MATDNTKLNAGDGLGDTIATDDVTTLNGSPSSGIKVQRIKVGYGSDGSYVDVDGSNALPVSVTGTATVTGAVSVSNFPATQPVSGTVAVSNFPASQAVTGPLTDTQLRASAVPVSGTFWQATQPVSIAASVAVTGTFWQATQPISASALPLPSNAAQETGGNLATLVARTPALGAAAAAASSPVTISTETATGNITTQNLVPNGAATAGSAVELTLNGATGLAVQVTGTYTGALSLQVTLDGARWETVTGAIITSMITGVGTATIASATVGVFTAPVHGALKARITGLAAMTGTAAVTLRGTVAPTSSYVSQPTAGNLNVTATLSANTPTLAAGANLAGDVGVQYRANATGAAGAVSALSPATPAAGTIKASAGRLIGWQLVNNSAALRSVKLFNVAAPTLGTTAAAFEIDLAAGQRSDIQLPGGISFATACTWSVTSAKGLTDNTATGLAANDVSGAFFFA